MRIGQNPAKSITTVIKPAGVTVAVVNFIPFTSGYYEQSAEVLKYCLQSIRENTDQPFDLMVFDNHSCKSVRELLLDLYKQGKIQYLVLSEKNIGKIGAWNFMFGAAQGKYITFADNDIYFQKGWLSASVELFEAFPKVGMVTARPLRTPMEYSTATLEWAKQTGSLEEGRFLDWETFWEHVQSLGRDEAEMRKDYASGSEYRLSYGKQKAFVGATHFQFMALREVLQKIVPLPSEQPMRGERALDIAINGMGLLRLTTDKPLVRHMGNVLPSLIQKPVLTPKRKSLLKMFVHLPGIRHFLLWLNNQIFRLYFFNVD